MNAIVIFIVLFVASLLFWRLMIRQLGRLLNSSLSGYNAQLTALKILEKMGEPAVEPLIEALRNASCHVHSHVAAALGKIGDARAIEPLITLLKKGFLDDRRSAEGALVKIGKPAVNPLIAALDDEKYYDFNRNYCLVTLIKIGKPAVLPLIAILRGENLSVNLRIKAAVALGAIKDARAVESLIAALKNVESDMRREAATALGMIKDARAVEALIAALIDAKLDVRGHAAAALGQIKVTLAVEPLIATLKDENFFVRGNAAIAIGQIGDACAVEPLIAALKDESGWVRECAAKALLGIGWKPSNQEETISFQLAIKNWDELARTGSSAVESLVAVLKDEAPEVRSEAAKALGIIKDVRAVKPLITVLNDPYSIPLVSAFSLVYSVSTSAKEYPVRRVAANALLSIGVSAVDSLIETLNNKKEESNLRRNSAWLLGEIKDARAIEPLAAALNDDDQSLRQCAVDALKRIKPN